MRVVFTGGGTGGHAYPAVVVAEALRAMCPECELLYLGGRDSIESRLAAAAGIDFVGLTGRKPRPGLSPANILTAASMAGGFTQAVSSLRRFRADLVIGTGGYASVAVVLAQAVRGGKTLIHEANAVPGRANLWLSRFATRVCVNFEDSARFFPADKTVVTGMPVRSELLSLPDKKEARRSLGLNPDAFTIAVLGGSQGAATLNRVTGEAVPTLSRMPVQVLHQTGVSGLDAANAVREAAGWGGYHVHAYFDSMAPLYAATDLVLSRSGASTVAEITVVGLPSILVPYPYARADEQRLNAEVVARDGGAIVVANKDLTADLLVRSVERFLANPGEIAKMAEASRKLGRPEAAETIARQALEMI